MDYYNMFGEKPKKVQNSFVGIFASGGTLPSLPPPEIL